MTLYWPADPQQIDVSGPRLHAFIVGVGDYPHLLPGAPNAFGTNFGLKQLTTTVLTAKKVAQWLATTYNNQGVPLGSIELFLSPAEQMTRPDGSNIAIEAATLPNINAAFRSEWLQKRSMMHKQGEGSISLFYFAGHGLSAGGALYLLPSDFSDPAVNKWDNCIDITKSRTGMGHVKTTQLFFIDACRETPIDTLTQANPPTGVRLVDDASIYDQPGSIATYYAAADGRQAYGPEDDVTYFASTLLESLEGAAAINKNGQWAVDTFSLGHAVGQIISSIANELSKPLTVNPVPSGVASVIHYPPAPHVRTSIRCKTNQAMNESIIFLQRGAMTIHSAHGEKRPWTGRLAPGDWNLQLTFQNYAQHLDQMTLVPPLLDLEVPR